MGVRMFFLRMILYSFLFTSCLFAHKYEYDLIIIGHGSSGIIASLTAREYKNKKILMVEKKRLGGSFIWGARFSVKTLVSLASRRYKDKNISILEFIRNIRKKTFDNLCKTTLAFPENIDAIFGLASFVDAHTIIVNEKEITSDKFIIATGSHSVVPNLKNIENCENWTPDTFFEKKNLPKTLIVIGAGPLGIELASSLQKIGVQVTLIMRYGIILPDCDIEVVEFLMDTMKKEGVNIQCNMDAIEVYEDENKKNVVCLNYAGETSIFQAEEVFFALNKNPNVQELNLNKAGVNYIEDKGIFVDSKMQTSAKNIYACGDVTNMNHRYERVSYKHAKVAVHNALGPFFSGSHYVNYDNIPKIIYTAYFPLAYVGFTEQDAMKTYGNSIKIYKVPYSVLLRANIENSTEGFAKFITDKNGYLLGAYIVGKNADLIIDKVKLYARLDKQFEDYFSTTYSLPSYYGILYFATLECKNNLKKIPYYKKLFAYIENELVKNRLIEWGFKN